MFASWAAKPAEYCPYVPMRVVVVDAVNEAGRKGKPPPPKKLQFAQVAKFDLMSPANS